MLQTFKTLLGFGGGTTVVAPVAPLGAVAVQVAPDDVKAPAVPVYPPIDGGIQVRPAEAVVATQSALIARLRRHLSLPQHEFDAKYLAPIQRAAALVGLLPATKDKHFTGQGGLFRMCLEIAVFSAQAADGVMFAGHAKIERRRQVEEAWRHAAFFCGLSVELHRPLTEMLVVEPHSGSTWNPFMGPLTAWAQQGGHDRVYVRWIDQAMQSPGAKSTAAWSLNYLMGADIMAELHKVDTSIVQTMAGVVTDSINVVDDHALAKLVRAVRRGAIERDQALKPSLYGALTQGSHLEPYFLDAMRHLLLDGDWTVNGKGSRLNWGKDGCFITWPLGAKDVIRTLQEKNVQGVPTQEATLLDMLLTSGIITRAADGGALWSIRTVHDAGKEVLAVRLANPASIIGLLESQPVASSESLTGPAPGPAAGAPPAAPGVTPPASGASSAAQSAVPSPAPSTFASAPVTVPAVPKIMLVDPESGEIIDPAAPQTRSSEAVAATMPTSSKQTQPKDRRQGAGRAADAAPSVVPPAHKAKGNALPDVEPAAQDQSMLDKQVVAALGPALAAVMATWVEDWNTSRKPNMFVRVNEGLALRLELLAKCGLEMTAIQEPLKTNGFILLTEVGGKARVMTKVRFNDKDDHAYILKTSFAKRCGFVLD